MKKRLLFFFGLALLYSFCEAQDTIVFKTGERDAVTVTSFGKKTINFILEDTAYSVNESRIDYIKYRNSIRYSYKDLFVKYDSANKALSAEMAKDDSAEFRPLHISIGVGGSSIESDILNNANIPPPELGPFFITQYLVYNAIIDYSVTRWLSFGIGAAYLLAHLFQPKASVTDTLATLSAMIVVGGLLIAVSVACMTQIYVTVSDPLFGDYLKEEDVFDQFLFWPQLTLLIQILYVIVTSLGIVISLSTSDEFVRLTNITAGIALLIYTTTKTWQLIDTLRLLGWHRQEYASLLLKAQQQRAATSASRMTG